MAGIGGSYPSPADRSTRRRSTDHSQLCDGIPMSRFGVMTHLAVLERAGLVIGRRHGRFRYNHLKAAPLHALQSRWLSRHANRWAGDRRGSRSSYKGGRYQSSNRTGRSRGGSGSRLNDRGIGPEPLARALRCTRCMVAGRTQRGWAGLQDGIRGATWRSLEGGGFSWRGNVW